MTDEERRPYLSSFQDRHGKTRWRYRRAGKTISIPGVPGEPEFEEAYQAAVEGREPRKAVVLPHPGAVVPKSLRDAWKRVMRTPEWLRLDDKTKGQDIMLSERFLAMTVVDDTPDIWADMLVQDLRRRHLKEVLARFADKPHAGKHTLKVIRKMIRAGLDEEWIEHDVSAQLTYRPGYVGWRAWTEEEQEKFEARWPIGSAARTCYALALWLGNRRSDIAKLKWKQFDFRRGVVTLEQTKGGKMLVVPITPMLADALAALPRAGDAVLLTAYKKPFSEKSLTGRMADWTASAGLPKGCVLHGLRKTLGKMMAEGGASTRQLMETLGHSDIAHAELYSREASQELLAKQAMGKVTRLVQGKKRRANG
jgi:integrase